MTEREMEFFRDEILKETNKKIEKMERDIDLLKQEFNIIKPKRSFICHPLLHLFPLLTKMTTPTVFLALISLLLPVQFASLHLLSAPILITSHFCVRLWRILLSVRIHSIRTWLEKQVKND